MIIVSLQFFKVDFVWINRDTGPMDWFHQLLAQIEIEQAEKGSVMDKFLDIHMYITSALKKDDVRTLGVNLALDILYKKVNIFSTRTSKIEKIEYHSYNLIV